MRRTPGAPSTPPRRYTRLTDEALRRACEYAATIATNPENQIIYDSAVAAFGHAKDVAATTRRLGTPREIHAAEQNLAVAKRDLELAASLLGPRTEMHWAPQIGGEAWDYGAHAACHEGNLGFGQRGMPRGMPRGGDDDDGDFLPPRVDRSERIPLEGGVHLLCRKAQADP